MQRLRPEMQLLYYTGVRILKKDVNPIMDQDLKVFVSSFMDDSPAKELKEERECVKRLIESMPKVKLWAFEGEPASPKHPSALSVDGVRNSDILVLLLAKTLRIEVKKEYDEAVHSGKVILAFIKDGPTDDDMSNFITDPPYTYKRFSSLEELEGCVRDAINNQITQMETAERVRNDRIADIEANRIETPAPFPSGAKIVLHLVPQNAPLSKKEYTTSELKRAASNLVTMLEGVDKRQATPDGFMSFSLYDRNTMNSYVLLCLKGVLESTAMLAVSRDAIQTPMRTDAVMILVHVSDLKDLLPSYVAALKELGATLPIYVFLTLIGVYGKSFCYGQMLSVTSSTPLIAAPRVQKKGIIVRYDDRVHLMNVLRKCFDEIASEWGYDKLWS
jgi:hypothetical protein